MLERPVAPLHLIESGQPSHFEQFGLVNRFPTLIKFIQGLINLRPTTTNEYGSKFIEVEWLPGHVLDVLERLVAPLHLISVFVQTIQIRIRWTKVDKALTKFD